MPINLPTVHPDREPLTENEAMRIGDSTYRLRKLRQMQQLGGSFTLRHATVGYILSNLDAQAILALLIERETLFLASFNVETQP